MQEGHVLKCRRACSQIQKGPFFCLNTHASCSCGAKQIYIKIKYSSPHMPSILPTHFPSSPNPPPSHPHPTHLPFPSHSPSAPIPLPFCPQPALFPSPAHSPSVRSPLSFRPQPTPRPSATHSPSIPSPLSPLRYSPNLFICYPVSSRIQLVPSSPRQLVNLPVTPRTCSSVTLSPLAYNLLTRLPVNSSTNNVTPRTCSPVTMSINTANLFPCPLVNPSSCKLFLPSYFFVGTCLKHCNANSSLFVTHFYRQKHNYQ